MNGHWLLNPTAISMKNFTVFYYIHAAFLYSTCNCCLYAAAPTLNLQQWVICLLWLAMSPAECMQLSWFVFPALNVDLGIKQALIQRFIKKGG